MTFKNLEDRFTKTSQDIYNRFPSPEGQYVQVKPDTASAYSRIKDDSRELPIVSTKRDLERVAKFLKSGNGVLFIGKQLLLQTGNTFAETRLYNPASPLVNTVPFTHSTRYINQSNISGLLGILGTGASTMPSRGFLQKDTVNLFTTSTAGSNILSRFLNKWIAPINNLLGTFASQNTARPEDTIFSDNFGPFIKIPQTNTQRGSKSIKVSTPAKDTDVYISWKSSLDKYVKQSQTDITGTRIFRNLEKSNKGQGYFNQYPASIDNATNVVFYPERNLSDPYNRTPFYPKAGFYDGLYSANRQTSPDVESGIKADIIKFMFTTTGANQTSNNVHFRAFLSSLRQTVTPEFNEQRYIGRTERFVTYGGVKRAVSLKFHIAAFSQSEINTAWLRVNYLTGLAFPTGVSSSGFMIPPLFKITVGNIYDNQPCYINTLEFNMLDESTTFDIDAEVSQVIEVTMQLTLLEKTTQLYDSPFYAITEALPVNEAANLNKMLNTSVPNINISTPSYDTLVNTRNDVGMNLSSYTKINRASLPDININTPSYGDLSTTLNNTTPKFAALKGKIVGDAVITARTLEANQRATNVLQLGVSDAQLMRYRYGADPTTLPPTPGNIIPTKYQVPPMGVLIKSTVNDNIEKINDALAIQTERSIRADIRSKMTTNFSIPPIVLYDENSNYKGPSGQSVGIETINGTTNLLKKINSGLPL